MKRISVLNLETIIIIISYIIFAVISYDYVSNKSNIVCNACNNSSWWGNQRDRNGNLTEKAKKYEGQSYEEIRENCENEYCPKAKIARENVKKYGVIEKIIVVLCVVLAFCLEIVIHKKNKDRSLAKFLAISMAIVGFFVILC